MGKLIIIEDTDGACKQAAMSITVWRNHYGIYAAWNRL